LARLEKAVIAKRSNPSRRTKKEWIASAFAKASSDKSLRSQ
jgi:hypothetical protein